MPGLGLSDQLKLMRGGALLGTLTVYDIDQPVFRCYFKPEPAFEQIRHLWDTENLTFMENDEEAFDQAYQDIQALGLRLMRDNGDEIDTFDLGIDGSEACFRY